MSLSNGLLSYVYRHSALSRASSRQTGGNELERAATLFPGRSTRATCGPPFSRLHRRTYWPVRVRFRSRNGS
jgi:hypothetical protein